MSDQSPYPLCRHIFPNGARCHSPALRGKPLCYYHSRQRTLVDTNRYRTRSVALPPLEDRGAIQTAINEVLAALAAEKLNRHSAGLFLYGIQMALQNLARAGDLAAPDPVKDLCPAEYGEVLAPEDSGEDSAASTAAAAETQGGLAIHLPCINKRDTHEYDSEPPDNRPLTKRQQKQIKTFEYAFCKHYSAKDYMKAEEERRLAKQRQSSEPASATQEDPVPPPQDSAPSND